MIYFFGDSLLDIYHYGSIVKVNPEYRPSLVFSCDGKVDYYAGGGGNALKTLIHWLPDVKGYLFGIDGRDLNLDIHFEAAVKGSGQIEIIPSPGNILKRRYVDADTGAILLRVDEYYSVEPGEVEEIDFSDQDIVIVSDYGADSVRYLTRCNKRWSLCFIDPHPKNFDYLIDLPNLIIKLNREEFGILRKLIINDNGIPKDNILAIIITKGREGSTILFKDGTKEEITVMPVEKSNPCGAGDIFFSSMVGSYLSSLNSSPEFDRDLLISSVRVATEAVVLGLLKEGTIFLSAEEIESLKMKGLV